jgi:membrane associated rhomboid family serine protease
MWKNLSYYLRRFWWALMAKGSTLTVLLVVSNVGVFVTQLVWFYYYRSSWFDEWLALSRSGLAQGNYWQLLSYAWLHSEVLPIHILFNLLLLFFLGQRLEWPLGKWRFSLLYGGGVVSAGLAWLLFDTANPGALVVGASGAVFALFGGYAAYDPKQVLKVWLLFIIPLRLTARTLFFALVSVELVLQYFNWLPGIAHTAHLGGAAFGWILLKIWRVKAKDSFYPIDSPVTRL